MMGAFAVARNETSVAAGPDARTALAARRAQLDEVMQSCGDVVLAICYSVVGDIEVARDLRQDVFVRAFDKLDQYKERGPLRNWVLAMARKRALDAAKHRRRWWNRLLPWSPTTEQTVATPAATPDPTGERLMVALAECLEALPDLPRMTILLRYNKGMSCPQIAEMEKKKPGAIYERIARTLPRLRECIESKQVTL